MTPLTLLVGDPGLPKSPGALDLVVHFLQWKKYRVGTMHQDVYKSICQAKCVVLVGTKIQEVKDGVVVWLCVWFVWCAWFVHCVCSPTQRTRMCLLRAD